MADNYLENKFEELRARKAGEQRARQAAWKKRMDAYRRRLAEESAKSEAEPDTEPDAESASESEE